MRKDDLIKKISSKNTVSSIKSMQLSDEQSEPYFNLINSLNSESTRESYKFCLEKFLSHNKLGLTAFLRTPHDEMTSLIIKYFVDKKISKQYKNLMNATLKHACGINDFVLNWKKIKKFVHSEKTGNETNGKDRAYTHEEIHKILDFCDQRIRTAFLILASTGMRIGALQTLKIDDLEKMGDIYKINVYSGKKEEYIAFCTPQCAIEIDNYLEYRKRRAEKIIGDSYLIVKQLKVKDEDLEGKPFNARSL